MIPELRRAINAVGNLKGLNTHQLENIGAILILNHYKHTIPEFDEKDFYISEITRDGALRKEYYHRRNTQHKKAINDFMVKNAIVK